MLATMGYIPPEVAGKFPRNFPGYLSTSAGLKFADIPNGLAAVSKIPALGWAQIVAYAGYWELFGPRTRAANTVDYASITLGDYGFKVLTSSDPAEKQKKLAAIITYGRLAMMAIIGMFPGRLDGLRVGRLGALHRFTSEGLRGRAWRARACGILGPRRVHLRWRPARVQASTLRRAEARKDIHACDDGIHNSRGRWKSSQNISRVFVNPSWAKVC